MPSRWTRRRSPSLITGRTGGPWAPGCWSAASAWTPARSPPVPRSRRRRTLHPGQRALPIAELEHA